MPEGHKGSILSKNEPVGRQTLEEQLRNAGMPTADANRDRLTIVDQAGPRNLERFEGTLDSRFNKGSGFVRRKLVVMGKSITTAFMGGTGKREIQDPQIEQVDSFVKFRERVILDPKGRQIAAFLQRETIPRGIDYYIVYVSRSKDKRKPPFVYEQRYENGFLEGAIDENMVRRLIYTALINCFSIAVDDFGRKRNIPYDIFILDGSSIITNPIFPVDISKPEGLSEAIYNIKESGMEPFTPKRTSRQK
nr:hypothetical protein [Candidatus Levybacteria bacterium]